MAIHQDVSLTGDGRILAGTLIRAGAPSGAGVLFVHGLGSSRATNIERAEALCGARSATCLAFDLSGHGDSAGRLTQVTPRQNLADVVTAYDALVSVPGVDPARIGVCAASYGAYLAVLLTALRSVDRMLLRAPALYRDDSFDRVLSQRSHGDAGSAATPLAHLALFTGQVTIVESEHDEVISHDTIRAYLAARPTAAHVVQAQARHALTDPQWRAAFQRIVLGFFSTL